VTDTPRTPPPTAAAHHRHPFTLDPGRWEAEHARALRTGHVRDHTCTAECEPVLVYERTRWGWLAWTVPGDGSRPELPHQIGVLTPSATRTQRAALRWLTRRPALRIGLTPTIPGSLRLSTLTAAAISVFAGLFGMTHGIPTDVALPAMAIAPLLAEHLPGTLDARDREHVRSVEDARACRYPSASPPCRPTSSRPPPSATATNCAGRPRSASTCCGTPPTCSRPTTPARPHANSSPANG
jgi:hypothetical protein